MINEYLTIGVSSAIIVLIVAWMFTTSRVHWAIRCFVGAVVLAAAIYNWTLFTTIMSEPIADLPPDGAYIVSGLIEKQKKIEYVWVISERGPKTYIIPYSEKTAKALEEALEKAKKQGGFVKYHRPKDGGHGDGNSGGDGTGTGGGGHGGSYVRPHGNGDGSEGGVSGNDPTGFIDGGNGGTFSVESPLPRKD